MKNRLNIFILILLAAALLPTGCARKPIDSAPPVKTEPAAKTKDKATTTARKAPEKEPPLHERDLTGEETGPLQFSNAGLVYIQVGAFADIKGAKDVMSKLIADGYKGSRFARSGEDGFYRVHAGVFPDRECAERALKKLRARYPDSFIFREKTKKETQ